MMKNLVRVLIFGMIAVALCSTSQGSYWWQSTWNVDDNWNNASNWLVVETSAIASTPPTSADAIQLGGWGTPANWPVVYDGATATSGWTQIREGASLTVGQGSGGAALTTAELHVGNVGAGTLNVNSGTLTASWSNVFIEGGGTANISNGGAVYGGWQFSMLTGGAVNLTNGTLDIGSGGLNISGGLITTDLSSLFTFGGYDGTAGPALANSLISSGNIVGAGGAPLSVSFNTGTWKTEVTAVPEPATMGLLSFGVLALIRRRK